MRYSDVQVVFKEIPNEISLAIQVTDCLYNSIDCHPANSSTLDAGEELSFYKLNRLIQQSIGHITCVLFLGGESEHDSLVARLKLIHSYGLKTALYSNLELNQISEELLNHLDYLKYGRYNKDLGALNSPLTNQRLINIKSKEILNHYLLTNEKEAKAKKESD